MFTAIMNNGEHRDLNCKTIQEAETLARNIFTAEEIAELEISIVGADDECIDL